MADTLLKELSNVDIDWIIASGQQKQVASGTVLLHPRSGVDAVYLLVEGALTVNIPRNDGRSKESLLPSHLQEQEITRLQRGEIVGETVLFDIPTAPAVVRAVEDSIVLLIPHQQLAGKLRQDSCFSAHFYRAIALLLSERLQQMLTMPKQLRAASDQPLKEALFLFGELQDSDVDWFVAVGQLEKLAPNKILIPAGRPLDALYIILDGLLSVGVHEEDVNMLALCFECVEKSAASQTIIERLSRGEMSGTISFLNPAPSPVTIRAIEESMVLAIPRSQLTIKLQQDTGFASRFYRVLAIQLSETLQTAIELMGHPQQRYQEREKMDQRIEYGDELNLDSLNQVAQGAARFNWMLRRLGVM